MRRSFHRHAASHDAAGAVLMILLAVGGARWMQRRPRRRRRHATGGDKAAWLARAGMILPHVLPLIGLLEGARRALYPGRAAAAPSATRDAAGAGRS